MCLVAGKPPQIGRNAADAVGLALRGFATTESVRARPHPAGDAPKILDSSTLGDLSLSGAAQLRSSLPT